MDERSGVGMVHSDHAAEVLESLNVVPSPIGSLLGNYLVANATVWVLDVVK